MSDSFPKSIELKKRSLHERIIVAKVLLESVLDDLPSVQPEIIRCKDCKHYMQTDTVHHRGWCWWWNHITAIERYCSEGTLRGDSDDNH